MTGAGSERGELALVLHTHMPYVEGYGTWPFGEEWLWEALATCYLPLTEALAARPGGGGVTVSLTPVLADQLAAPGVAERFAAFLRDVRRETHRLDAAGCREGGRVDYARELERAALDYERALSRVGALGGDLLRAFDGLVSWTSSATHAVLPLLATDAGVRLQVETGIAGHRARFGGGGAAAADGAWRGGFWLPECAYAPWLDPLLTAAGVRAVCVDFTDLLGRGSVAQLTPLASEHGPTLVPIDRSIVELVWSDDGYPAHAAYRDYHAFTVHHHRVWANSGETYDRGRALKQASADAADFVTRVVERLERGSAALGRPALAVCAIDTELLGHWWYEGIDWLLAVLDEAERQGLAITQLDDALERHAARPLEDALQRRATRPLDDALRETGAGAGVAAGAPSVRELPTTTWGTPRDLSTWDGPQVADFAWRMREAELRALVRDHDDPAGPRALRELLALQASDWAFQATRGLSGGYPEERAAGHARALAEALAGERAAEPVRGLAPCLAR
jgi:1,4-alpha-glucan branching enzyme